jgi:hypothetical protein
MRARGHAPASPSGGSDGAAASGFNPSPFPARASARPLLSCLYEAGSSRLLRLLYLNALLLALFVTRDMAYRDFPKVWVLTRGGISAPPQGPIGGLIGSKYAGLRTLRGANGPGCIDSAGKGVRGARNVIGDTNLTFNVIMTSNGDRPTLQPMLLSILPQLRTEDYFTLISDPPHTSRLRRPLPTRPATAQSC